MSFFFFDSADGTRLRGWSNDSPGSPVVLVPGIAVTPEAFPSLVEGHAGLSVRSCYMRGTHGSGRPSDETHVRLSDHADDVVALLDAQDIDKAVLVGSGYGVQVVFDVLRAHPDRVHGILAVAGLPDFAGVDAPASLSLHEKLLHPFTSRLAEATRAAAPKIAASGRADAVAGLLSRTGLFSSRATSSQISPLLKAYGEVDTEWFERLLEGAKERSRIAPSEANVPITFLIGDDDTLVSMAAVRNAAMSLPDAKVREVHGGIFLGVEQPAVVLEEALGIAQRAGLNPMDFLEVPATAPEEDEEATEEDAEEEAPATE